MAGKYGMITEQGDLGLGFSALNENDASAVRKNEARKETTEHDQKGQRQNDNKK